MLNEIFNYLHNYFNDPQKTVIATFNIDGGYIDLPFLKYGQYFCINGSDFNDGVHQYPCTDLKDEVFYGSIWPMKIPADLLTLIEEIEAWQEESGAVAASPYASESFGGYSYTKASASDSSDSSSVTWIDTFASRLAGWRKI